MIRSLSPEADFLAVRGLYGRAADYILLESGLEPDDATVADFFTDAPPGIDLATSLKLGLFAGDRLDAIADLSFGFPCANDAYIGLLLIAADQRGRGLGREFLDHLLQVARSRGAWRLFVGVLAANPKGRAFWQREGFVEVLTTPPRKMGTRTHVVSRMERRL